MEETSSELTKNVKNWLSTQGYPLEMRVAKAAKRGGLLPVLGSYYYDEEFGTHREVDVVAIAEADSPKNRGCHIRVVFECKSSVAAHSKPWVVLTADEIGFPGSTVVQRYLTDALKERWMHSYADIAKHRLRALETAEVFGYSLVRAQLDKRGDREREDQAFAALMQASKAAFGVCQKLNAVKMRAFVLPVIVVDTALFSCRLNSEEELSVEEIESATLLWGNRLSLEQPVTTIIEIMGLSAVEDYARRVRHTVNTIAGLMNE